MTILELITLAVAIFAVTASIAYHMQRKTKTLQDFKEDYYTEEELENIKLAEELYNKDLRPVVAKKSPKKTKSVEQVEVIAEVVEASQTVEAVLEPTKPKKKRKYYPKKPKTSI